MKPDQKPKVGLLLLAAEFFEAKRQTTGVGRYGELPSWIEADATAVQSRLAEELTVVCDGVVHNPAQARTAARRIREEAVDALVVCHLMWGGRSGSNGCFGRATIPPYTGVVLFTLREVTRSYHDFATLPS